MALSSLLVATGPVLLLTIDEAAHALRLSRAQLYNLIRRGVLQTIKIDNARRIPVAVLEDYIEQLLYEQHGESIARQYQGADASDASDANAPA